MELLPKYCLQSLVKVEDELQQDRKYRSIRDLISHNNIENDLFYLSQHWQPGRYLLMIDVCSYLYLKSIYKKIKYKFIKLYAMPIPNRLQHWREAIGNYKNGIRFMKAE